MIKKLIKNLKEDYWLMSIVADVKSFPKDVSKLFKTRKVWN
jgi:hypothetical protein